MTATEGRIKPQSISDDVRAIEEALAAKDGDYIAYVAGVSEPARLRRVLDTMQAMGEALKGLTIAMENIGGEHVTGREGSEERLDAAYAALALYEGKQ